MSQVTGRLLEEIGARAAAEGRWVEAERFYRRALSLPAGELTTLFRLRLRDGLARALASQGRTGAATELALESVIQGTSVTLPRELRLRLLVRAAQLAIDAGFTAEAIDLHGRLLDELANSTDRASVWNNLGTLHWRLGRLGRAREAFRRALFFAAAAGGSNEVRKIARENLDVLLREEGEPATLSPSRDPDGPRTLPSRQSRRPTLRPAV